MIYHLYTPSYSTITPQDTVLPVLPLFHQYIHYMHTMYTVQWVLEGDTTCIPLLHHTTYGVNIPLLRPIMPQNTRNTGAEYLLNRVNTSITGNRISYHPQGNTASRDTVRGWIPPWFQTCPACPTSTPGGVYSTSIPTSTSTPPLGHLLQIGHPIVYPTTICTYRVYYTPNKGNQVVEHYTILHQYHCNAYHLHQGIQHDTTCTTSTTPPVHP